ERRADDHSTTVVQLNSVQGNAVGVPGDHAQPAHHPREQILVHAVALAHVGEKLQQDLGTQHLRRRATLGVTHSLASASRSTAALTERAVILHGLKEKLDGLTRSRGVLLEERDQVALPDAVQALYALHGEERSE